VTPHFLRAVLLLCRKPERRGENLAMLNKMYNKDFVSFETFKKIKCPTLIMAGDNDEYTATEDFVKCRKAIPGSQLAIIAGCGHVIFYCNFPAVWDTVEPFIKK
jgi:pimeloyl-ACP methyl ester carboxylesterase